MWGNSNIYWCANSFVARHPLTKNFVKSLSFLDIVRTLHKKNIIQYIAIIKCCCPEKSYGSTLAYNSEHFEVASPVSVEHL